VVAGVGGAFLLARVVPGLEASTSPAVALLALGVSAAIGLAAGVIPAVRAAQLDPVAALHAE
jgi:putative ABC transport system permease protein